MNNRYRAEHPQDYERDGDAWKARDTNEFLVAAYAMIANEITTNKKWPWALPNPNKLAEDAHKKIQNQLLHVRFRDNTKLMSSLLIDYTTLKEDRNWITYANKAAEDDAAKSQKKVDGPAPAPAPEPAPADEEEGAA